VDITEDTIEMPMLGPYKALWW